MAKDRLKASLADEAGARALKKTLQKPSLFWILQGSGWAAFGVAMVFWGLEYWSLVDTLVNKGLLVLIGFALTVGFRRLYRRARARSLSQGVFALLIGALSFGGAAVWIELHELLLGACWALLKGQAIAVHWTPIQRGMLLYYGFVLLAWSLLYNGINAWTEVEEQKARANRAEALARDARLRALQFQLEPHFLFNTLNAISTLVVEGNGAAASRMIARLSDFLRMTLDAVDTPVISVAEELEFVRRYLEIEQVRFGDRLHVTIDAAPDAMGALVPALVLQPLLENAVKHGVLQREGGGSVAVAITAEGGVLRLSVVDDGPGVETGPPPRQGVGLANTAARLAELYGGSSRFSLDSGDGGFAATIEIPFRSARPGPSELGLPGESS
jgi:two-component system LytT family sensor kinase